MRKSYCWSSSAFLLKIFEILQRQDLADIICWTSDGDAFMIKNQTRLSEEVLPKYFKHNNFSSFVRQLNMYDFHESKKKDDLHQVFQHQMFHRDKKELLLHIKRKSNQHHPMRLQQDHERSKLDSEIGDITSQNNQNI